MNASEDGARVQESHLSGKRWHRSSHCGANGACVEVAVLDDDTIAMRSSQHPESSVLIFTAAEWAAFLDGLRRG
ncbi:DUF397 domain-containing protein [Nonomuraea fuscirosea]|uniref:DUF397 domain-containing protein n=1 Tax=Nonomuraea fuscirosea TaxID=1291556 RepID=UPI0033BFD630